MLTKRSVESSSEGKCWGEYAHAVIKECEYLQHWRLGWSKVPELSLSFGELFSPDGGVVRPWGLGPKLDQTLETWGLLDVHTTFDDEICLSGTRSGQGSTLWALLGGGKSELRAAQRTQT